MAVGFFPVFLRSNPTLERNENFISNDLPQSSGKDYMLWPKSLAGEHLENESFLLKRCEKVLTSHVGP